MDGMTAILARCRAGIAALCGQPVVKITDYAPGLDGLPPADVLKLETADMGAVIRPSGTEPKLKLYLSVSAPYPDAARELEAALTKELEAMILQKL